MDGAPAYPNARRIIGHHPKSFTPQYGLPERSSEAAAEQIHVAGDATTGGPNVTAKAKPETEDSLPAGKVSAEALK